MPMNDEADDYVLQKIIVFHEMADLIIMWFWSFKCKILSQRCVCVFHIRSGNMRNHTKVYANKIGGGTVDSLRVKFIKNKEFTTISNTI